MKLSTNVSTISTVPTNESAPLCLGAISETAPVDLSTAPTTHHLLTLHLHLPLPVMAQLMLQQQPQVKDQSQHSVFSQGEVFGF